MDAWMNGQLAGGMRGEIDVKVGEWILGSG